MAQEEFANYQRALNAQRVNHLKSTPKLSPKVLLNDEDFDVSINNIPMSIKPPVLPVQTEQTEKQTSKELW